MRKLLRVILSGHLIAVLLVGPVYAAGTCGTVAGVTGTSPYTAETHSYADVADCVADVAAAAEIIVPAGDGVETWDSQLLLTQGVTLTGPGVANLTITNNVTSGAGTLIVITPGATALNDDASIIKISGFTFDGAANGNTNGLISASHTSAEPFEKLLIINNKFQNITNRAVAIWGIFFGAVSGNTFDLVYSPMGTFGRNSTSWDALNLNQDFGSVDNLYFEGNTIQFASPTTYTGWMESGQGGRAVYRYNTFNLTNSAAAGIDEYIDTHGLQTMSSTTPACTPNCSSGTCYPDVLCSAQYSTMLAEVYNNSWINGTETGVWIRHRGGKLLMYDNTLSSVSGSQYLWIDEYACDSSAINNEGYTQHVNNTYLWNNKVNGGAASSMSIHSDLCASNGGYTLAENTDFWNATNIADAKTKGLSAGYAAYTCPHPLADPLDEYTCNSTAGTGGYLIDDTTPTVTAFTLPATATSLTVAVSSFAGTDNVAVTGYCIALTDSSAGCGWAASPQSTVIFSAEGAQSAYAFCRDAAGNISASATDSVTITLPSGSGGQITGLGTGSASMSGIGTGSATMTIAR